ncbi:hypothetical protein MOV75_40685, partial [Bradyrhizobium sp. PRIMUS42]|nr:hypothetical protein [Bradyrhizobium sp. PRIMUS42]
RDVFGLSVGGMLARSGDGAGHANAGCGRGDEQVALKSGDLDEGSQVAVGQAIRPAGFEFLGIRFGS